MANKPLRPCAHPGCAELVRGGGYCEKHKPKDVRVRDAAWHSWYGRKVWKRLSTAQLWREPYCRSCAARGERTLATEVDHIVPHRGNWIMFTDPDNLQSLCHVCHSAKTYGETIGARAASPGRKKF